MSSHRIRRSDPAIRAKFLVLFSALCDDGERTLGAYEPMLRKPSPDECAANSEPRTSSGIELPSQGEITQWLATYKGDEPKALESLLPLVYRELHRLAVNFFGRERSGHTLQPTALVNEVYLRLVKQDQASWQSRAQFFAIAAQMMRRILVSHARARQAAKRGGGQQRITLEEGMVIAPERDVNLINLDEALTKLETIDPDKSRMVELRFFSGLSVEETAEVMGVSPRTVDRQWQTVKAWLHREMSAS